MSHKSQEKNMRKLAGLLSQDLSGNPAPTARKSSF